MQDITRDHARMVERLSLMGVDSREMQQDIVGLIKRIDLLEQRHEMAWSSAGPLMSWHPIAAAQISRTAAHVEALKSHHAELHTGQAAASQAGAAMVNSLADTVTAQTTQIQSLERTVTFAKRAVVWASLAVGSGVTTLIAKLDAASIKAILTILLQGSK